MNPIRVIAIRSLVFGVRLYQATLRPLMGGQCRFSPSCSEYAIEAIREHGPMRGVRLAAARLLSCHPFGRSGWDPVPPAGCITQASQAIPNKNRI